jgi:hypothetical protein
MARQADDPLVIPRGWTPDRYEAWLTETFVSGQARFPVYGHVRNYVR